MDINEVIATLSKDPKDRNSIEMDRVLKSTREIPFFKKYINEGDKDVHQKCCKFMRIEYFKKDESVFLIDSIGTKFYLILQGKVGVYIRLPKKSEEQQPPDDSLTCVKELNAGEAFGELALLNNKPRLASIISHESNTVLAVLDKKDFSEILKEKEEAKLMSEMGFFAKMPFFKGWNINLVKHLYLNVFRVKYEKGDRVFEEAQEPNAVFIITQGQFDIEKVFTKEINSDDEFDHMKHPQSHYSLLKSSKKASTVLRLMSYMPHELFGEEDLLNGEEKRTFSAVCRSVTGECIMIKRRDFFIRIFKEETARAYLEKRLNTKNKRMNEKLSMIKNQLSNYSDYLYSDQAGLKYNKEVFASLIRKKEIVPETTNAQTLSRIAKANLLLRSSRLQSDASKNPIKSEYQNESPPQPTQSQSQQTGKKFVSVFESQTFTSLTNTSTNNVFTTQSESPKRNRILLRDSKTPSTISDFNASPIKFNTLSSACYLPESSPENKSMQSFSSFSFKRLSLVEQPPQKIIQRFSLISNLNKVETSSQMNIPSKNDSNNVNDINYDSTTTTAHTNTMTTDHSKPINDNNNNNPNNNKGDFEVKTKRLKDPQTPESLNLSFDEMLQVENRSSQSNLEKFKIQEKRGELKSQMSSDQASRIRKLSSEQDCQMKSQIRLKILSKSASLQQFNIKGVQLQNLSACDNIKSPKVSQQQQQQQKQQQQQQLQQQQILSKSQIRKNHKCNPQFYYTQYSIQSNPVSTAESLQDRAKSTERSNPSVELRPKQKCTTITHSSESKKISILPATQQQQSSPKKKSQIYFNAILFYQRQPSQKQNIQRQYSFKVQSSKTDMSGSNNNNNQDGILLPQTSSNKTLETATTTNERSIFSRLIPQKTQTIEDQGIRFNLDSPKGFLFQKKSQSPWTRFQRILEKKIQLKQNPANTSEQNQQVKSRNIFSADPDSKSIIHLKFPKQSQLSAMLNDIRIMESQSTQTQPKFI